MVEAGCFASYGIEFADLYALYADQIAKVLKGAKPADLAVAQPSQGRPDLSTGAGLAADYVTTGGWLVDLASLHR